MFFPALIGTFIFCFFFVSIAIGIFKIFCPFIIVHERECHIINLLGNIVARYDEPGIHFLVKQIGWNQGIVYFVAGEDIVVHTWLEQCFLRNLPVNSEEGSPMGVGIWYEMRVSDPVKFRFENSDPQGSLSANIRSATVRCLSNLALTDMMEDRHAMSSRVRAEVAPRSNEWGYQLGSVFVREVHFSDRTMVKQIQEKVVNRLRQVTASIKQDGDNRVNVISSDADRKASIEFAKAAAIRPQIVGETLQKISEDPEVAEALFTILEIERILKSNCKLTLIPANLNKDLTNSLLASQNIVEAGPVRDIKTTADIGSSAMTFSAVDGY